MNKRLKFAVMLLAGVLYAVPAKADIEAIEAAINAFVIKYEAVKKQVQDVLTEAKNLSSEVKQGFRDAKRIFKILKILSLTNLTPKKLLKPRCSPVWKTALTRNPMKMKTLKP